jgi:hypothetical protein
MYHSNLNGTLRNGRIHVRMFVPFKLEWYRHIISYDTKVYACTTYHSNEWYMHSAPSEAVLKGKEVRKDDDVSLPLLFFQFSSCCVAFNLERSLLIRHLTAVGVVMGIEEHFGVRFHP